MEDRDHDLLIRIDEKMKITMDNFHAHIQEDATNFAKSDVRLSNLEKSYWKIMGGVAVIVLLAEIVLKGFLK